MLAYLKTAKSAMKGCSMNRSPAIFIYTINVLEMMMRYFKAKMTSIAKVFTNC